MKCDYHYCPNCDNSFQNPDPRVAQLEQALRTFVTISFEAHLEWDADNDSRVGKLLLAMAGKLEGYRGDITAIHALLAALKQEREACIQ